MEQVKLFDLGVQTLRFLQLPPSVPGNGSRYTQTNHHLLPSPLTTNLRWWLYYAHLFIPSMLADPLIFFIDVVFFHSSPRPWTSWVSVYILFFVSPFLLVSMSLHHLAEKSWVSFFVIICLLSLFICVQANMCKQASARVRICAWMSLSICVSDFLTIVKIFLISLKFFVFVFQ